jgi:methyl-accepting chemotaxis protein
MWNDERGRHEQWMTAFAPIIDTAGTTIAVVAIKHQGTLFSYWFDAISLAVVLARMGGGRLAMAGTGLAWHVTRPISALIGGVECVASGALSLGLPVRSRDEVGHLTSAFNDMVEGLRQRDFIRNTFGRYVSPARNFILLTLDGPLPICDNKPDIFYPLAMQETRETLRSG